MFAFEPRAAGLRRHEAVGLGDEALSGRRKAHYKRNAMERGPGESDVQPAIVLLHGFALDARMWRRQVDDLSQDYRVVTIDLPGFGPQARAEGEVSPADAVSRAMDAAGLLRAHFVGTSFGAAVAIDFALSHPRRVQSLTLVGPTLLGRRSGVEAWTRAVSLAAEGDRATACEVWLDDPLFDGVRQDEALFEEVRRWVLDYGGAHWTGAVTSRWEAPDPAPRLGEIDVPALIVSGEADVPSYVLMAEACAKAMPRARREIIQGAGHFVNLEQPKLFNEVLRYFLGTV
jgi:3-oxoadipate enol-lactonase